ncbi:hypothetical protein QNI16_24970 [Cytophagaceae bacterium YF14B1]|uniref:Uncharacterized protein n=1 Tax=Xanthocytophaga flava TaxID=3048013 RepID=A0AAE3QUY7_9BACT|nr:hypothetical protein [Xanthocytophaga flavus]MDJ1483776.1 hypothetical protein [Xanthocytophaga flavus]
MIDIYDFVKTGIYNGIYVGDPVHVLKNYYNPKTIGKQHTLYSGAYSYFVEGIEFRIVEGSNRIHSF